MRYLYIIKEHINIQDLVADVDIKITIFVMDNLVLCTLTQPQRFKKLGFWNAGYFAGW